MKCPHSNLSFNVGRYIDVKTWKNRLTDVDISSLFWTWSICCIDFRWQGSPVLSFFVFCIFVVLKFESSSSELSLHLASPASIFKSKAWVLQRSMPLWRKSEVITSHARLMKLQGKLRQEVRSPAGLSPELVSHVPITQVTLDHHFVPPVRSAGLFYPTSTVKQLHRCSRSCRCCLF